MRYLLDTNVLSEFIKIKPNEMVLSWLNKPPNDALYISVLSLGEIRKGLEKLPTSKKKELIRFWLEHTLQEWFGNDNILTVTHRIADQWGRINAHSKKTLPAIESLIAATAIHHDLVLVTRNTAD